jgi:hypothetical protein
MMTRSLALAISMAALSVPSCAQSEASKLNITPPATESSTTQAPRNQWIGASPKLSAPCERKIDMVVSPTRDPRVSPAADYPPLTKHCKFEAFRRQTYSPFTFISASWEATWAQAWGQWPQYGGGMQGWGKRFGATIADTESRRFIQGFVLSSLLHQDPRYFPSGYKKIAARAAYSVTRVVITRADRGDSTINTSEILGTLFTSSLQNAYYPRADRGFSNTLNRFTGALTSDGITDLLHEFSPDMRRLFHRHAPEKVIQIEDKLPIPAEDKP